MIIRVYNILFVNYWILNINYTEEDGEARDIWVHFIGNFHIREAKSVK